ncbi:hypothetical protein B9Z55_008533 [Caenorhabditis nigoni]|uniref:F-box domain-containing protein n=1 Tax=Caenorhabditis nigoni TaxID=1611254 RepID=A0A2G5UN50_9PELO|nr:hypothetical protein B9Z55_008533 [Caenorhabditis nigoni]
MSSDVEKSIETTEKLANDLNYDTNWCDMPPEVKSKCIGKMEFKERLSLRCTAKAERSLVDSEKIEFQKGSFLGESERYGPLCQVSLDSKDGSKLIFKNLKDPFELMKYIWKVGNFENLVIHIPEGTSFEEKVIKYTGKMSAKNVEFNVTLCATEIILAILKNTKNEFESIKFEADHDNDLPIDEILATPQIQNAKYWHIRCYDKKDTLRKVAQVWIDKNSVIGSTFQLYSWLEGPFDEFLEHFAERIVSKSEERVRVRTDNADRHILLEWGWNPILKVHFELDNYFRLLVISADIKESEYDDDCIGWIRKIHPNPDIDYNYFP